MKNASYYLQLYTSIPKIYAITRIMRENTPYNLKELSDFVKNGDFPTPSFKITPNTSYTLFSVFQSFFYPPRPPEGGGGTQGCHLGRVLRDLRAWNAPGHAKARDLCSDHAPGTGTMRDLIKIRAWRT